jgi:hypothetical protein
MIRNRYYIMSSMQKKKKSINVIGHITTYVRNILKPKHIFYRTFIRFRNYAVPMLFFYLLFLNPGAIYLKL